MRSNRLTRCLCAALFATLIGFSSPAPCAAGEPNDYPGIADGNKLLAAGPLHVTLTIAEKQAAPAQDKLVPKEAELLLLTEQFALFRYVGKDASAKIIKAPDIDPSPLKITMVKAIDPQTKKTWKWEFDFTTRRFTGAIREPEKIEIKSAATFTPEQKSQFLFFTYQWLVDQLEDTVIFDDQELAKALIKRAERTHDAINQLGLDTNVAKLFRNMNLHYVDLIKIRTEFETTLSGAANANVKLKQIRGMIETERRWIEATHVSAFSLNFLSLMLGGEGSLAPDPNLMRHGLANLQRKLQLEIVDTQLQQVVRDKIRDLGKEYNTKILERKERDKAVAKRLGLPYLDWYAERSGDAASKKDWPRLAERFIEIQNEYKKVTPHGDPWLQLQIYQTQSLVNYTRFDDDKLLLAKAQQNAADRYKLARQMFDIIPQTPADEILKEFRGDLIFKAAESSVLAAELELGDRATLRNSYSPKAVHALRLLSLGRSYQLEDVNRTVSEVKFRAMAHSYMHKDALDFGSQFAGSRDTAKFHLTMAKLHLVFAKDKKLLASKEYTKNAIKAGYYDFLSLQNNSDLKKVLSPDFVFENMAADVSIRIVADRGKIKSFVLTNESPFAIVNGSFSAGKVLGYNRTPFGNYPIVAKANSQTIRFLRPKEFLVIADSNNINNAPFFQQNPLFNVSVTNQGNSGLPVKVKLER